MEITKSEAAVLLKSFLAYTNVISNEQIMGGVQLSDDMKSLVTRLIEFAQSPEATPTPSPVVEGEVVPAAAV